MLSQIRNSTGPVNSRYDGHVVTRHGPGSRKSEYIISDRLSTSL